MEVKPAVAVVTQKLTDILNDKSVADNKIMMHQLKGVQKSLKKLRSFSKEKDGISVQSQIQRARDHLHVLYQVEDEIEKFTFRVAQQRKRFGFLMKQTFFFNNLTSSSRLKRKIKKIQSNIDDEASTTTITSSLISKNDQGSLYNSPKSISGTSIDEDDEFYSVTHALTQKSSSHVWPISEIPSTPSPKQRLLTRSFSTIPYPEEHVLQQKKLTFSYSCNEEETNFVGLKEVPKHTSSFSYQEDKLGIFGLNEDIKSLVKRLTQQPERKQKDEMFVPIVGEVGSGKATLARSVYRNIKIKDHFEIHEWISVTEEDNAEIVLHHVSKKVTLTKDDGSKSPEQEAEKSSLLNHLKGKRYMIVLNGIRDHHVLEDLRHAFPDENNGSKVLFTCREFKNTELSNMNPHIMDSLNEKESWNMFLKKAGKEKEADQIDARLKCRILKTCNGLPLNIVLIARLLSTKKIERWSLAPAHDQCSNGVLAMCYNDLSIHSKLCLLYLTLFPKDYDIPVRRLLRLWIAEGFVKRRSQQQQQFPEDLVQIYFEDLVDRSMIQITKLRSDNSPRRCRLVSAFHDYLLPKAQDISLFYIHRNLENFEDAAGSFGVRRMVQHVGITCNPATNTRATHSKVEWRKEGNEGQSSSACSPCFFLSGRKYTHIITSHSNPSDLQNSQPHSSTFDPSLLRTYVSFNFQRKDMPEKAVGILLGKIINNGFGLLRVLDLEGVCKPSLPDKLGHLCHLRYLGLRWTSLESLPESVGDLSYLETLDVKHTSVDSLPDSIWNLRQLRHLNLNNIRLAMPPRSSSTLLTLWGLVIDEKISVNEGLGKLCGLRELGIKFHLEDKSQGELLKWIAKLVDLQSLRLTSVNDMGRPSKLVLKPLPNLEKLSHLNVYGNLEKLPALNEFPPTLKVLTLSISMLDKDPLETLEQLPFLIVLRLLAYSYTRKRMVCRRGGFKKLQVLKLWLLKRLEEWEVEEDAMESLKELDIRCCHGLNNIPSRLLQKQRSLEELILTDMPDNFVERIKKRKSKDTSLTINPWKIAS